MRYETTVEIHAPLSDVWPVLVDVERWPEWTKSMQRVQRLDAGALAVGARTRTRQPRLGANVFTVTALEPERSFDWVARRPGATIAAGHSLEATDAGTTRVLLTVEIDGALAPLLGLLVARLTRRYVDIEAAGLKARAEAARTA